MFLIATRSFLFTQDRLVAETQHPKLCVLLNAQDLSGVQRLISSISDFPTQVLPCPVQDPLVAEAQQLELRVLLEAPDLGELQRRQPDATATLAAAEACAWPVDFWWQVVLSLFFGRWS